jgi:tRNA pseudouridine55 synthase
MNAVICLDKEKGITSHDAVFRVRRLLRIRKAGHAGTLDPMATGLLLVCLNEATKVVNLLTDCDKEYAVTMKLGESTDTYDAEGSIVEQRSTDGVSEAAIRNCIDDMRGTISQLPPMYSAIKMNGEPLYRLARQGITVERTPRTVSIAELDIEDITLPYVRMRVSCSKGTYIRSLCHDIGEQLAVGAHMTALCRTRIGPFRLEESVQLDALTSSGAGILSLDQALSQLPEAVFCGARLTRILHGNPVAASDVVLSNSSAEGLIRLKDDAGNLLGIGRLAEGKITVVRLFAHDLVPTMKEDA